MGKNQNQHLDDSNTRPLNQNNQTSDDPRDGQRLTDKPEVVEPSAAEKKPEQDRQDQETIEAFGERGSESEAKERADG